MTDITIYHNPACGTSRNTLAMIRNSGVEPTVIEVLKNPPSTQQIQAWLAAMGLVGQGDLESLMLADGREVLLIARKGCCLDYLAFPGTYCASCPKQDDDVRKTRQREDALAMLAG